MPKDRQPFEIDCTPGPHKGVPGARERVIWTLTTQWGRTTNKALGFMFDKYVDVTEGDKGAPRKALPDGMRFEIVNWKVRRGPKNDKGIRVQEIVITLEGDYSQAVLDGIFQCSEGVPRVTLHQTDLELPQTDESGGDEETAEE